MCANKVGGPQEAETERLSSAWAKAFVMLVVWLWTTLAIRATDTYVPSGISPPALAREFRGVWVATVGNIDWPSTNALASTAQQKAELLAMLDRAVELRLNTIIFQVRPGCDAIYPSKLEPWSEYLTGTMGRAPEPYYDPLAFALEECHQRGLELHAWFNPYRARHLQAKSPVAPNHISRTHPEWVKHCGKALWLDPGEKGVQEYSLKVILDVLRRYDIDGVHFDDYFYPQDASGKDFEFPDDPSWRRYGAGGKLSRDDWRRENVNSFVRRVYREIKAVKPWVKFGISPHGIWRPGNPPQIKGLDAFAILRADSRKWLMDGWVDYFAPQLYWSIEAPETSFPVLLAWWAQQNPHQRVLCPGLNTYNVGGKWTADEIINQIRLTRHQPGASGEIHWDMRSLMRNATLGAALETEVYSEPALVPATTWLQCTPPAKPAARITIQNGVATATCSIANPERMRFLALQTRRAGKWTTHILPRNSGPIVLPRALPEIVALTAIDRCENAGIPVVFELRHTND